MANLGTLIADLGLNTAKFEKGLKDAEAGMSQFERRTLSHFRSMGNAAGKLKTAVAAIVLGAGIKNMVDEFIQAEAAAFQLEARLKSTGGVVGFTSDQLKGMARSLQSVTAYGDDAIIEMQNLLLTFTNLRGGQFAEAQEAVLNMATAMGTDLKSAAMQLGKALNDPAGQMSALARSGVILSDSQKQLIKDFTESGNIAAAQGVILKELQTEFGGAARAAAQGLGGSLKQLQNAWGDLQETIVKVVTNDGKNGAIQWLTSMIRWVEKWTGRLPTLFIALFGEIDKGISWITMAWGTFTAYLESGWEGSINFIRSSLANFLEHTGKALSYVPGMDDVAAAMQGTASFLNEQVAKTESLETKLKRVNDEYDRQLRIINMTVQGSVDAMLKEEERQAMLEKTTGADAKASPRALSGGGIVPGDDKLQADLERLRNSLLDKETIEVEAWFNRQAILDEAMAGGLLSEEQHKTLAQNLEKFHQDKLSKIAMDGASERQKFAMMTATQQTQHILGEVLSLTNGVAQHNKKMFQINKIAGIANATINAFTGASKSLATYPWPLAGVMAALHLAAGFAQVNAIKSQSYGGGGGVSPSIGGGTGATDSVYSVPSNTQQGVNLGGENQQTRVVVNLDGQPIIDTVQRAQRDGRIVIDAEAA